MKPLNCLTLFLESGKRFKLPSGETFDQLRQPQPTSNRLSPSEIESLRQDNRRAIAEMMKILKAEEE